MAEEPLDHADWAALTGRAIAERMEGLLAVTVKAGAVAVTGAQMTELTRLARSRASADILLERETLRVSSTLESAGISFRVLKGPAWAHSAYPDPIMRGFGDVDVLVEPSQWYSAVEALERSGARRLVPELRPGFDVRFGKDATLLSQSGKEIDLHRTLVVGPYGLWLDCEEVMGRPPAWVRIGDGGIPVLDPEVALIHACYNAALADDPPRLVALRDVAQMVSGGKASVEEVFELARRWKGVSVVRRALQLVTSHLGVQMADTQLGRRFHGEESAWDRFLLASYRGPARGYTSQLAGVAAVPGIRARAAYIGGLLRPQPAYLQARGLDRMSYVGLVARKLRGSG